MCPKRFDWLRVLFDGHGTKHLSATSLTHSDWSLLFKMKLYSNRGLLQENFVTLLTAIIVAGHVTALLTSLEFIPKFILMEFEDFICNFIFVLERQIKIEHI